jgi:hypothetical protein
MIANRLGGPKVPFQIAMEGVEGFWSQYRPCCIEYDIRVFWSAQDFGGVVYVASTFE